MQIYDGNPYKNIAPLDTLGQLPTAKVSNLQKRARSKWYTERITAGLLFENSPLHKYYQRAYYCNHIITQNGRELKSKYCDTRICHICNRIRTAKMMNGYLSQLKGKKLQFVTLTVPCVYPETLRYTCEYITKEAANIVRVFRERRGMDMNGIRKMEITYNPIKNWYHPHLHFIVDGYGNELLEEWMRRIPGLDVRAQACVDADQGSLNELFKYTTKIIAHKRVNESSEIVVYVKALDVIMQALSKKRCFQPFGSIRKVSEQVQDDLEAQIYDIPEYSFMEWVWDDCDWVNKNRATLTGYVSPDVDFTYE